MRFWLASLICAFWLVSPGRDAGLAQSVFVAGCLVPPQGITETCLDNSPGTYVGATVVAQGYGYPGDGGGGTFVNPTFSINGQSTNQYCMSANGTAGNSSNNTLTITNITPFPTGITLGNTIAFYTSGGTLLFSGASITAYSVSQNTITVSVSGTITSASGNFYIGGANGGTTILDGANPANCFLRVTSNYSQKEWGAYSDGQVHNGETANLQSWLYANQPHIAVAGTSVITGPLYCGVHPWNGTIYPTATDGTVIQGPPPSAVSAGPVMPAFVIEANDTNAPQLNQNFYQTGTFAMLIMGQPQCGLSAVGMVGNSKLQNHAAGQYYNIVNALAENDSVINHSQLSGGYNGLDCTSTNWNNNVTVLDSSILGQANNGVNAPYPCPNLRIERSVISNPGNDAIAFSGVQALIENNVIEQSLGDGVACCPPSSPCSGGGQQLVVNGNYFDNNGKGIGPLTNPSDTPTYNFHSYGCNVISITGNQFHRSGAATEGATGNNVPIYTAQVWFDNQNDTVSMAGNVNLAGNDPSQPTMRPDFDIELGKGATVTNFSYADSATPQNLGVFGPTASLSVASVYQPVQENYITGFGTQSPPNASVLDIFTGSAADSSNAQLITLPTSSQPYPCTVDLTQSGYGGLDVGGSKLATNTQYNFFEFSQGGYSSKSYCIASTGVVPNFPATNQTGFNIAPSAKLYGYLTANGNVITNIAQTQCSNCPSSANNNPFGGIAVGDTITDTLGYIPWSLTGTPTTITSLASLTTVSVSGVYKGQNNFAGNNFTIANGIYAGEMIGNDGCNGCLSPNGTATYITAVDPAGACDGGAAPCITLSQTSNLTVGTSYSFQASGGYTITMSAAATASALPSADTLLVWNDRYRLVASLFTTEPGSQIILAPFAQNGNTFYLSTPVPFTATVPQGGISVTLPVPKNISVEAFGRCVASAKVYLFNSQQTSLPATAFPLVPGYDTQTTTSPDTAFPFRIYTSATGQILAQPQTGAGSATLECMLDGWNLPRGP